MCISLLTPSQIKHSGLLPAGPEIRATSSDPSLTSADTFCSRFQLNSVEPDLILSLTQKPEEDLQIHCDPEMGVIS